MRTNEPSARAGRWIAAVVAMSVVAIAATAASASASPTRPQGSPDPRGIRTPDDARYTLSLTSDPQGFVWTGTERIAFTNTDPTALTRVYLRLWDNAVSGCAKPLAIRVTHLKGGSAHVPNGDCTVLRIGLPAPLGQGDSTEVSFDLRIIVPNLNWRFGHIGSMALVGNAIPVLAIHDLLGWHLEPYTSNGESFYSQVSDFTVTFTTPKSLALPATGVITASSKHGGTITTTFEADGVRDFAWASGPLSEEEATAPTGVLVKVWWPSNITKAQADSMLTLSRSAMASHAAAYGAYPYPEVDVVLGTFTRFGGMEYPQFVMTDVSSNALVHELAHQWWFGLVGDDQYTEPWLDESFATYATDLYFGNSGGGCGAPSWPSGTARLTNAMAYWDAHPSEYVPVVYGIGPCALHTLAAMLGAGVMATFLHDYAVEHALGWSTTDAFKVEAQTVADGLPTPIDLTPFWQTYRIDDVP